MMDMKERTGRKHVNKHPSLRLVHEANASWTSIRACGFLSKDSLAGKHGMHQLCSYCLCASCLCVASSGSLWKALSSSAPPTNFMHPF
jgi:hypothetical protein